MVNESIVETKEYDLIVHMRGNFYLHLSTATPNRIKKISNPSLKKSTLVVFMECSFISLVLSLVMIVITRETTTNR